jgi:hypothetical protein
MTWGLVPLLLLAYLTHLGESPWIEHSAARAGPQPSMPRGRAFGQPPLNSGRDLFRSSDHCTTYRPDVHKKPHIWCPVTAIPASSNPAVLPPHHGPRDRSAPHWTAYALNLTGGANILAWQVSGPIAQRQSSGLIIRWLQVRILLGPPACRACLPSSVALRSAGRRLSAAQLSSR